MTLNAPSIDPNIQVKVKQLLGLLTRSCERMYDTARETLPVSANDIVKVVCCSAHVQKHWQPGVLSQCHLTLEVPVITAVGVAHDLT